MTTTQTYSKADLDTLGILLDLIPKIADKDKQTLLGVALGLSAKDPTSKTSADPKTA